MSNCLFIFSAMFFIATFGIHMVIYHSNRFSKPAYTKKPLIVSIPWVSGFILPVIPLSYLLEINWLIIFAINVAFVFLLGPLFTRGMLMRFASSKGLGYNMAYSFIGGGLALVFGLMFQ